MRGGSITSRQGQLLVLKRSVQIVALSSRQDIWKHTHSPPKTAFHPVRTNLVPPRPANGASIMSFQFTPYALPAMIGGIISALLALSIWRRQGSGVIPFVVLTSGGAMWSLFSALELSLRDLPTKTLASNLTYIG